MRSARFRNDGTRYEELIARAQPYLTLIRHDTCGAASLAPSLAFAQMEAERGLHAVYFVWTSLPTWGTPALADDVRRIRDAGHGIGLHYDTLHRWLRDGTPPGASIERALEWLRTTGDVTMAAAHGQNANYGVGLREYQAFAEFSPTRNEGGPCAWNFPRVSAQALGIVEVYLHGEHNASLSDSRGMWNGWHNVTPRPFERLRPEENLGRGVLDELREGDRLHLLVHPIWWEVS